ncbi:unnamed protein product [Lactuca saligna]|uniref:Uncharacterized protein n=1 Tax=Lactuca saligna TaxID=75948 RepID=A0AA35ZUX7_LACSI|nr:unnamed protein product [Lactuca saligna]
MCLMKCLKEMCPDAQNYRHSYHLRDNKSSLFYLALHTMNRQRRRVFEERRIVAGGEEKKMRKISRNVGLGFSQGYRNERRKIKVTGICNGKETKRVRVASIRPDGVASTGTSATSSDTRPTTRRAELGSSTLWKIDDERKYGVYVLFRVEITWLCVGISKVKL